MRNKLLEILEDPQFARLTAEKVEYLQKHHGYQITGFVLCHPETGERCVVEKSACRYLSNDGIWNLMHGN